MHVSEAKDSVAFQATIKVRHKLRISHQSLDDSLSTFSKLAALFKTAAADKIQPERTSRCYESERFLKMKVRTGILKSDTIMKHIHISPAGFQKQDKH